MIGYLIAPSVDFLFKVFWHVAHCENDLGHSHFHKCLDLVNQNRFIHEFNKGLWLRDGQGTHPGAISAHKDKSFQ